MMKPGIGTYDKFKAMFDKYSKQAGKEQFLIQAVAAELLPFSSDHQLNLRFHSHPVNPFGVLSVLTYKMEFLSTGIEWQEGLY